MSPLFVSVFSDQRAWRGRSTEEEEGMHLVGLRAYLGDLRISDLDILFVQSTQTGPMDSSIFSYGSYL